MDPYTQQILAQIASQGQQASKWSSPQNLINLATLGLNGVAGLGSGAAASRSADRSAQELAYRQAQDAYLRRLQGRTGLQNAISGQLDARQQAARDIEGASPLGWEQLYQMQMARARGLSDVAGNFQPLRPGPSSTVGGFVPTSPNLVGAFATPDYRRTISQDMTDRAVGDRRNVIAGLSADTPDKLARENQLMQLLVAQMQEASKPLYREDAVAGVPGGSSAPAPKKRGFWSKLGSVALPIAGMAAGFIPGVGPIAGAALAGAGAGLGRAAGGGSVKDAIMAGAGGAAAGYGMAKAGIGEPRKLLPFEGPNLANFGMMPGGANASPMVMPDVQSFPPPSLVNGGMQGSPTIPSMKPPSMGAPAPRAAAPVSRPQIPAPPASAPAPQGPAAPPLTWQPPKTPAAGRGSAYQPPSGFNVASILPSPRPATPGAMPSPVGQRPSFPMPQANPNNRNLMDQILQAMSGRKTDINLPGGSSQRIGAAPKPGQVTTTTEVNMIAPNGTRVPVPPQYIGQLMYKGWRLVTPSGQSSLFGGAKSGGGYAQ